MPQINKNKCLACGECVEICPLHAIDIKPNGNYTSPQINQEKCIICHECEKYCPGDAIK